MPMSIQNKTLRAHFSLVITLGIIKRKPITNLRRLAEMCKQVLLSLGSMTLLRNVSLRCLARASATKGGHGSLGAFSANSLCPSSTWLWPEQCRGSPCAWAVGTRAPSDYMLGSSLYWENKTFPARLPFSRQAEVSCTLQHVTNVPLLSEEIPKPCSFL